jgi:hypothetical protein
MPGETDMKRLTMIALSAALLAAPVGAAAQEVRAEREQRVQFERGASSATVSGRIRGYELHDYLVNAREGQRMTVQFRSRGRFTYFLVRGPGSEENLYDGSSQGEPARLTLPASGNYRIRVFQMRNAARRGATSDYSVTIAVDGR